MNDSAPPSLTPLTQTLPIAAASGFGLVELANNTSLVAQLLPTGVPFAWRHGPTLINQLLAGPADQGLFRLLLRWHDATGQIAGWKSLVAPGETFARSSPSSVAWSCSPQPGLSCETRLALHARLPGWSWCVQLRNDSATSFSLDVLHAQDLGLADEGAVRNNEAYTSQYIDLLPQQDDALGWTILARQNQSQAQGRWPWVAFGCVQGASAFCTDGWQFYGQDHRLANQPAAALLASLPSQRLQYEFALAGLQSRRVELAPGSTTEITFVARFVENHPAASSSADLDLLREVIEYTPPVRLRPNAPNTSSQSKSGASIFATSPFLHGEAPTDPDLQTWFPGPRRHAESSPEGALWSFFQGATTHVVTRDKEASLLRPHGHILRSGDARWFDVEHLGLTCYAAGIFSAQVYLGHPSFARLLSVVRNALNVARASGQRVFVRRGQAWHQLGIPSVFAMTPVEARWIYRSATDVIQVRVSCPTGMSAACLELQVLSGAPTSFLITHELVLGAVEFEHPCRVELHAEDRFAECRPAAESLVGKHQPGVCFAIAAADPAQVDALGGDGLLYEDGMSRAGPYIVLRTATVVRTGVILVGTLDGPSTLPTLVNAARAAFSSAAPPSPMPAAPVRMNHEVVSAISRIDEILPWFTHNAAIHFSAPHGLEQYGGAAWGVRDVCQGSVEWLLAAGEFGIVRKILTTVFGQQYANDGSWPQWFMFPPYRFIQQAHSHGDVCFWPVKALCDYIEASNDLAFLEARVGYTGHEQFESIGPQEAVIAHCDRVIDQCEARFVAGTALVNYGDGDWDDTLQPADPTLRTRGIL